MKNEKFKLWKLSLGTIHIDGKVTSEEEKWFHNKIEELKRNKILDFSDQQIDELKTILYKPIDDFMSEVEELENPADCSLLLHYLRMTAHLDSDFSDEEKQKYKKLETACLKNVNVKEVESRVVQMEERSYHKDEVYSVDNKTSRFEKAFKHFMKLVS